MKGWTEILLLACLAIACDDGATTNPEIDNGGSANGGSDNGGSANGGSDNGGSTNGGSANGGSDNGGSTNGGSDNGGSDNGGTSGGESGAGPGPATGGAGGSGAAATCDRLFGLPAAQTGLDETQCGPSCACDGDEFSPPQYSTDTIEAMRAAILLDPPDVPADDPYAAASAPTATASGVCAVLFDPEDPGSYRLATFDDEAAATEQGGFVTHTGACGLCSSLADLAVYVENPDLTGPVRDCGIQGVLQGEEANMECLTALGFTLPCARIWYFNTVNTRTVCGTVCASLLGEAYQTADGELNECIQCDEDNSGPVFKAVAGRTRRNSGVPSGLCRPCDTVAHIVHDYL